MANALAGETSPYLLQHKDNPVDWRPWGPDAFDEARRRGVPVFLSVGYSTCYWCHVMEREVFENHDLAAKLNESFVAVKVDREERPDVDEHYMTATQVLSGQGGWPMSVFLTPDGGPFFAGTYFPPTDMQGRPGFGTLVDALADAWANRRDDVNQTIEGVTQVLARLARPKPPSDDLRFDNETFTRLLAAAAADFDPQFGGFGRAPKFPRQTLLALLLEAQSHDEPLRRTLDAMANGGIRDHLGGGFHRYSTDAKWLVPHFEIMLYDQAMLAPIYARAAKRLGVPRYESVARRCLDFVLREMTSDGGAFFTAFDAEVDAHEGGNYLWTPDQVRETLGDDAAQFNAVYGLDRGFNFADPHGPNPHTPDENVLFLAEPEADESPEIAAMREKLLAARATRKQPLLDTKIVTSWNGLMIEAFAVAADALDEPRYRDAANRAADWLMANHWKDGKLARSSRDGKVGAAGGVLDDYAHLGLGLLALKRIDEAKQLADAMLAKFTLDSGALASTASDDPDVRLMGGIRRSGAGDTPLPAGNGSAALLLLGLRRINAARDIVDALASQIDENPGHASTLTLAALKLQDAAGDWTLRGQLDLDALTPPPEVTAEAGDVVQLSGEWVDDRRIDVLVTIADGFHLYAPGRSDETRPIELEATGTPLAGVDYPEADDGGTYRGQIRIAAHLAAPIAIGGEVELALAYQACDDTRCLPAVRKVFVARLAEG